MKRRASNPVMCQRQPGKKSDYERFDATQSWQLGMDLRS
jgi:hypothetical protein